MSTLLIQLFGNYGVEGKLILKIPEEGTYKLAPNNKSIKIYKVGGTMFKTYMLPSDKIVEITEVDEEYVDFLDNYEMEQNPRNYN